MLKYMVVIFITLLGFSQVQANDWFVGSNVGINAMKLKVNASNWLFSDSHSETDNYNYLSLNVGKNIDDFRVFGQVFFQKERDDII